MFTSSFCTCWCRLAGHPRRCPRRRCRPKFLPPGSSSRTRRTDDNLRLAVAWGTRSLQHQLPTQQHAFFTCTGALPLSPLTQLASSAQMKVNCDLETVLLDSVSYANPYHYESIITKIYDYHWNILYEFLIVSYKIGYCSNYHNLQVRLKRVLSFLYLEILLIYPKHIMKTLNYSFFKPFYHSLSMNFVVKISTVI